MDFVFHQVLSLLGGFYKAKSAEAFALMKLVQVKTAFCKKNVNILR